MRIFREILLKGERGDSGNLLCMKIAYLVAAAADLR